MSTEDVETQVLRALSVAETIAKAFHEAYEELAPGAGYTTRSESRKPWEDIPANNKTLMINTVGRLINTGVIQPGQTVK